MLRREIPHHAREGRVIRVARSHIAPAPLAGELSPLQPHQPWDEHMQPLCYWHDEPVALQVESAPGDGWIEGRQWLSELPASWFSLLSTALQVGAWLENHRFCSRCGERALQDGSRIRHALLCVRASQLPANFTLYHHAGDPGEAMLLARSPRFPPGRYSTLAGFIEPGESAEEAVHREVFEEVGVHVDQLRYHHSQAWPFPHSLMLGYFAEATTQRIMIDGVEISDAAWFSPRQLPALPPPYSISRDLIETHLARWR